MIAAAIEQLETARWLQTTLAGDAALTAAAAAGVYSHPAPADRTGVWVTYQMQTGQDSKTMNLGTVWSDELWLVRAYAETRDYEDLAPAAVRVHQLLANVRTFPATPNATIYSCTREQPWMLAEVANGRTFRSLGGLYRIQTQLLGT